MVIRAVVPETPVLNPDGSVTVTPSYITQTYSSDEYATVVANKTALVTNLQAQLASIQAIQTQSAAIVAKANPNPGSAGIVQSASAQVTP